MKTEYNKFSKKTVEETSDIRTGNSVREPVSNPKVETWTALRPVNFRMYASTDAMIIRVIEAGEKVKANGQTAMAEGEVWMNVTSNGATGYVMKKYFVR